MMWKLCGVVLGRYCLCVRVCVRVYRASEEISSLVFAVSQPYLSVRRIYVFFFFLFLVSLTVKEIR